MLKRIETWFESIERRMRGSVGADIAQREARRRAWLHFHLFDHAFFRYWWTNFDKVAEGVYRSNHPDPARLVRYKEMGIRSILNLRGDDGRSPWLFEKEACDALGIELRTARIYARKPARRKEIVALIDTMRQMEKPFVMHCKSGADRAGFASVLYKAVIEGVPLEEARKHLSLRYAHANWTATGIVGHIFDMYEARNAESPIDLETWFRTEYDHNTAAESFAAKRAGRRTT
ncbi:tyrosine-protein phosphatase [Tropicimonas isoalkanivorans]|uniref:Tyrosine phosphatase family protein n=1 Tax=Tropicimonas isoalkanivorans TaxID=441112 RepID=A0A1I1FVZ6_9RHOB|nr:tyrosine-protein phosphatase [Tropicimonas isoalkanivorans]SFC03627.1 Tyrosine phosphatase family protein [Tropicimonas isoalkanivorans]